MHQSQLSPIKSESYSDIDHLLGSKDTRYFGQGFKQVSYEILEQSFSAALHEFNAKVDISFSNVWSKKGNKKLVPHLSTIDAMWFNCYGCEQLLNALFDMSGEAIQPLFRSVEMKAGSEPEELLNNLMLNVRLIDTMRLKEFYTYRSTLEIEIGSMRLRTIIEHGGEKRQKPILISSNNEDFFSFYYTEQCNRTVNPKNCHEIVDVYFRQDFKQIQGRMNIKQPNRLEACFLSPIEVIISLAQLAQALIYKKDRLDRTDSETLWMRHVLLENFTHYYDMDDCLVSVWMEKEKSISKHGETWRMYRMLGTLGSSRCSYSLAHKLPLKIKENL